MDGWFGDTVLFELAELTKGANSFTNVTLNKIPKNYPGGIQWDGKYVALVDKPWIYRISVSGSTGKVVGRVFLKKVWAYAPMAIKDGVVVATTVHLDRATLSRCGRIRAAANCPKSWRNINISSPAWLFPCLS